MPALTRKITFAKMRAAGLCGTMALVLSACLFDKVDLPPVTYVTPSPPTPAIVTAVVKAAAAEEKLTPPLEMSAVRPTIIGPGRFFVCMREANPTSEKRVAYSVFFDNDLYKGSRRSVIVEACETQAFTPVEVAPPAPPPKTSGKRKL
jgi:hypothetical protein